MKKLMQMVRTAAFDFRFKQAVKKANEYHHLTGNKFMVLLYKNRPVVKSKKNLKTMIVDGQLKCTIAQLENIALYITQ